LDARLAAETGMTLRIADNPLHSVAIGAGHCLEQFNVLNGVLISSMNR
jgi:rod shape-determining protein MreB